MWVNVRLVFLSVCLSVYLDVRLECAAYTCIHCAVYGLMLCLSVCLYVCIRLECAVCTWVHCVLCGLMFGLFVCLSVCQTCVVYTWRSSACNGINFESMWYPEVRWTRGRSTCAENARISQNNNFERISRSTTINTALESWDWDQHVDVSTLKIHWEMTELRGNEHFWTLRILFAR